MIGKSVALERIGYTFNTHHSRRVLPTFAKWHWFCHHQSSQRFGLPSRTSWRCRRSPPGTTSPPSPPLIYLTACQPSTLLVNRKALNIFSTSITISLSSIIHHIQGLSAGHMQNGNPVVFATTLDTRGPAVFGIGKQGHTLIATGEHLFSKSGHFDK